MGKNKFLRGLSMTAVCCAALVGLVSVVLRTGDYVRGEETKPVSAMLSTATQAPTAPVTSQKVSAVNANSVSVKKSEKKTGATKPHKSSGVNYPVTERHFEADGSVYNNFSVKNYTDFDLDIAYELEQPVGFKMENNHKVQVLIFHTHTCESYLDRDDGTYPADYYPRSTDNSKNITSVGDRIEEELKKSGIGVIHDKTLHDYPSYSGSYERSYDTIQYYMNKYKDIKVVLDIHRDAIGAGGEEGKVKPFFEYKGQKCAQIMIMTGYSYEGGGYFPFWEENLRFAIRLQQQAETMYPGLTRPLNFGCYTYNLNVCSGSLLIEFGTDVNTLGEAKRSGTLLGKALAKVLQKC